MRLKGEAFFDVPPGRAAVPRRDGNGVPVLDPISLGRSRSAFSSLALPRIALRRAGFGAEHGSWTGGVIHVIDGVILPPTS